MELITGRRALDHTMQDKGWMFVHLVTRFRRTVINRKKIPTAMDETLNPVGKETLVSI
ncbi:conserved hypothetical protein [Ricinus communis]|uniref:Uncharacterized protein n=1 Tax=Ricinus communis TaxID=3988 RepID=B9SW70_RICCO|nr:conserved hypothetical protein [Ricinus communis]